MYHVKIYAGILLLTTAILAGCASNDSYAATEAGYNDALADATKAINAAGEANYEWRDSEKLLEKAAEAAKKGDYGTAVKLVSEAKMQGKTALVQSKAQANAGPR